MINILPTNQIKSKNQNSFYIKVSVLKVFVDFKGVYDMIWRAKVISVQKLLNINENVINWLSRFLAHRWTMVRYKITKSTYKQTKSRAITRRCLQHHTIQ